MAPEGAHETKVFPNGIDRALDIVVVSTLAQPFAPNTDSFSRLAARLVDSAQL